MWFPSHSFHNSQGVVTGTIFLSYSSFSSWPGSKPANVSRQKCQQFIKLALRFGHAVLSCPLPYLKEGGVLKALNANITVQ